MFGRILADQMPVIRSSELKKCGIHRQILSRAVRRGIVRKIDRAGYTLNRNSFSIPNIVSSSHVIVCPRR
jgi:hypothetical protein